ncbi:MAG: major capsid protein [Brevinema sp.]
MSQNHDFIRPFQDVSRQRVPQSIFALDHYVQGSCSQGTLIPILSQLCIPSDEMNIGNSTLCRLLPLVSPAMTEINMYAHYFFVPFRILWDETKDDRWSTFINGGVTGDATPKLPLWNYSPRFDKETQEWVKDPIDNSIGSLWDYLGHPVNVDLSGISSDSNIWPVDFQRRAYNLIYNEYYRNQNVIPEIHSDNDKILRRLWQKDYFTSMLPWQQRGTSPTIPITGFPANIPLGMYNHDVPVKKYEGIITNPLVPNFLAPGEINLPFDKYGGLFGLNTTDHAMYVNNLDLNEIFRLGITIDGQDLAGLTINDLRLSIAIQEFMELNARVGSRYTEYLKGHFNTSPSDARLQRPEYIGGTKAPVMISEVLQNSASLDGSTPQGNMAGHGQSMSNGYVGTYHAEEWGLIMGIMSIMPKAIYSQGMNKQWTQRTMYDYYVPMFANLSEQPVLGQELCLTTNEEYNNSIIGYQGRWDELRTSNNYLTGQLRGNLAYWTQQRQLDIENPPLLDRNFLECTPSNIIFVEDDPDAHNIIYTVEHTIKATRPLPAMSDPSLTAKL